MVKLLIHFVKAWAAWSHLGFYPREVCEQTHWSAGFCARDLIRMPLFAALHLLRPACVGACHSRWS